VEQVIGGCCSRRLSRASETRRPPAATQLARRVLPGAELGLAGRPDILYKTPSALSRDASAGSSKARPRTDLTRPGFQLLGERKKSGMNQNGDHLIVMQPFWDSDRKSFPGKRNQVHTCLYRGNRRYIPLAPGDAAGNMKRIKVLRLCTLLK
jgi:hypothetical protein